MLPVLVEPNRRRRPHAVTPEQEAALADTVGDEGSPKDAVLDALDAVVDGECNLRDRWAALAQDGTLVPWRRLVACDVLIANCVTYPRPLDEFIDVDLVALGIRRSDIADADILQNLPIERHPDEQRFVASLPIETSIGPAAVYFAVQRDRQQVMRAAVFPSPG